MGEESAVGTLTEALIHRGKTECVACGGCARRCPVHAITLTAEGPVIDTDRCMLCGICVTDSRPGCWEVRCSAPGVAELLRVSQSVVALLAAEADAALFPLSMQQVERSLRMLGFVAVEGTLLGETLVAREYERLDARADALLLLRSTCPVASSIVRKHFSGLTPALACVVPPYIAQARLIKALYPKGTKVVYVSPCYARIDEALDPGFDGAVDAAIDFLELKHLLDHMDELPLRRVAPSVTAPLHVLRDISLTDGFPRSALVSRDLTDTALSVVRGVANIIELCETMSRGEAAPVFVDMLACDGCVAGPAVSPNASVAVRRGVQAAADRECSPGARGALELLDVLPAIPLRRSFHAQPVEPRNVSDADVAAELAAGLPMCGDPLPDCGACGYATCVEHARAVCEGVSTWELCSMVLQQRLASAETRLAAGARIDPASGLPDARLADERIALELARHSRYGRPFALVVLQAPVPAEALRELSAGLAAQLRATDMLARLDDERFCVLLPDTAKTQAFGVADKLIVWMAKSLAALPAGGYTDVMPGRISAGVAMANDQRTQPSQLLAVAGDALSQALTDETNGARLALG